MRDLKEARAVLEATEPNNMLVGRP